MPLEPGGSKAVIERNTRKLIREGRDPKQAYAIANAEARRYRAKRAAGARRTKKIAIAARKR